MPEAKSRPAITLRDLTAIEDIRKIPALEREVWKVDERDSIPVLLLIAAKEAGSVLIGAFDGDQLIGFVFGFPGLEHGRVSIHSHMTAVREQYRDLHIGYRLKLAQRERVLAMGVQEITWTFDPLQARNAHFNFQKLGVVSDRYKIDFYGAESSSVLHQNGTDRLWVTWPLSSPRVQARLKSHGIQAHLPPALPVVRFNGDGRPARAELSDALHRHRISIEIPGDIALVEQKDAGLAGEWRVATRWAFTEALKNGFVVAEFFRNIRGQQGPGAYLLEKSAMSELCSQ
jgi:predicted GNAT superfamily acetyltransferase